MCSQGRIEYANGDVFEGSFENDHIVGHGVLKCADGSSYIGQWAQSQVRRTPESLHATGYFLLTCARHEP